MNYDPKCLSSAVRKRTWMVPACAVVIGATLGMAPARDALGAAPELDLPTVVNCRAVSGREMRNVQSSLMSAHSAAQSDASKNGTTGRYASAARDSRDLLKQASDRTANVLKSEWQATEKERTMRTRLLRLIPVVCLPLALASASPPSRGDGAGGRSSSGFPPLLGVAASVSANVPITLDVKTSFDLGTVRAQLARGPMSAAEALRQITVKYEGDANRPLVLLAAVIRDGHVVAVQESREFRASPGLPLFDCPLFPGGWQASRYLPGDQFLPGEPVSAR